MDSCNFLALVMITVNNSIFPGNNKFILHYSN